MHSKAVLPCLLISLVSFTGCKKDELNDPLTALNGLVKEYGYIGYQNPMEKGGTGVLVGGKPDALAFIAPKEECFPDESVNRIVDTSNISKKYNYKFQGNLGFLAFGTPIVSAGLGLRKEHTVSIELNGITLEYMNSLDVTRWYREGLDDVCKEYLNDVGFVIQALQTESLTISIKKIGGLNIGLNAENVSQFFDIEAGVDWKIEDEFKLVIDTPKYIGYQLGRLKQEDNGKSLYRAMSTEDNKFIFEKISLFDEPEEDKPSEEKSNFQKSLGAPTVDENSIFLE